MRPDQKDLEVLNLFYNRFYDLYEEINSDIFFDTEATMRFYKIREIFSVYKELLKYDPIKDYLTYIKSWGRPPLEGFIVDDLFSFIRNLLSHFPIFNNWNEVYINKNLATWIKSWMIDRFISKSTKIKIDGKGNIKYRIWEKDKKKMTYISVNLPEQYVNNIYLKDIISERHGVKFCIAFMKQILDTQIIDNEEANIVIMSQVYFPNSPS